VLAAVRARKKARTVLMPRTVNPVYRKVVETIVRNQNIKLIEVPFSAADGTTDVSALRDYEGDAVAAVVVPQPNYFGLLEDVDTLTDAAHDLGALAIGLVNPTAMALLKPPGNWGRDGADIAVGEGQPLGIPLSSGGPYMGFMCCKSKYVRQIPGRIVGRTRDDQGNDGFTLTLQAREQHIRRSKATSNICTNQGLMVVAATIYMSLLGPEGLRRVAARCHHNTKLLVETLTAIDGVKRCFEHPFFHEVVVQLDQPVADVMRAIEAQGINAGIDLSSDYPELGNTLLTCATESRTMDEIENFATHLERIMSRRSLDPPCAEKVTQ
jgi:glycine dehydrogenase subunit 1